MLLSSLHWTPEAPRDDVSPGSATTTSGVSEGGRARSVLSSIERPTSAAPTMGMRTHSEMGDGLERASRASLQGVMERPIAHAPLAPLAETPAVDSPPVESRRVVPAASVATSGDSGVRSAEAPLAADVPPHAEAGAGGGGAGPPTEPPVDLSPPQHFERIVMLLPEPAVSPPPGSAGRAVDKRGVCAVM